MRTVYVVAFGPSEVSPHGSGGFDWFPDRVDALERLLAQMEEPGFDVAYFEAQVPEDASRDDVTLCIEKNYDGKMP